jgi:hypothetical protein
MQFTFRSMSHNLHSARREIGKPNFPGIDTFTTSSKALLIDERCDMMIDFCGLPSRNSSQNLLLCDKH